MYQNQRSLFFLFFFFFLIQTDNFTIQFFYFIQVLIHNHRNNGGHTTTTLKVDKLSLTITFMWIKLRTSYYEDKKDAKCQQTTKPLAKTKDLTYYNGHICFFSMIFLVLGLPLGRGMTLNEIKYMNSIEWCETCINLTCELNTIFARYHLYNQIAKNQWHVIEERENKW